MIKTRSLFFVTLLIICSLLISQERGFQVVGKKGRIALIIGNGRYKSSPLRNPINDAADMARVLRERGFEVILKTDANHKDMEKAIREFGEKLRQGGIGFFYFSGHGMQVKGVNYLVPVDADIQEEDEIKFKAVDANFVLSKMDSAGNQMNVMILDACRDNPFIRSFRSSARGLAQMDAPRGSLIVYATSPGKTAADGEGRNGIFTKHLLKAIRETNLEVGQLLREVRRGVMNETDSNQVPWESSSLIGNFYFSLRTSKLPETEGLDLSDIEGWQKHQKKMNNDFLRVKNIHNDSSVSPEAKKSTWQQFLNTYRKNNPFSTEDEQLCQRAVQWIKELSKVEKPNRELPSLRSYAQNLSENEVGAMLKKHNFFSISWGFNKEFCNPSGDFLNSYKSKVINGDKVVLDHAIGMMWHQSGSDNYMTYEKAKQWIADLNNRSYAGYRDWRLPTLEEAASLLERTKSPYMDPKFSVKQDKIWTSDTLSGSYGRVWIVDFSWGWVDWDGVDIHKRCVRPVRSILLEEMTRIWIDWQDWQGKMKSDFGELEKMERSTGLGSEQKVVLWQKYLETYNAYNPFSDEDERLRQKAQQRIKELTKFEISVRNRVSLRSFAQSINESEAGAMLKRHNFFTKDYNYNKVWCNPSGDFSNSYESRIIYGDKVVLDHATGLMWHPSGSVLSMKYDKAKQWVTELNRRGYAGYHDWRLPTLEEVASLLERTKMNGNLYIDPKFSAWQSGIFTSDVYSGESNRVWSVDFIRGYLNWYNPASREYVRPVRSGQK